jgi:hypothetical protein
MYMTLDMMSMFQSFLEATGRLVPRLSAAATAPLWTHHRRCGQPHVEVAFRGTMATAETTPACVRIQRAQDPRSGSRPIGSEWSRSADLFAGPPTLRTNHLESEPLLEGVEVAV